MDNRFKTYVIEARNPDGSLNAALVGTEPMQEATEDQIINYYFSKHPGINSVTLPIVFDWFRAQGWHIRLKTW